MFGESTESLNNLKHTKDDEILKCEITKVEFAESLRLTPDSMFIENMFNLIDKNGNGYISFHEFFDVMLIFTKGELII